MKKSLLFFSLCLGACTSEDVLNGELQNVDEGEVTKIEAVISAFDVDGFDSRSVISMGTLGNIANPVWAKGDVIGIYPTTGDQLSFPIVDGVGTSTCEFNGGGWALKTSTSYTAYSPFSRAYYYEDNSRLPVSMLGQTQVGNDNSSHLGAYDIQIAKGTTPSTGKISFAFEHKIAIVRMDLKAPKAAVWRSLELLSDASFKTEAYMNLTYTTPSLTSITSANSVQLNLENVTTTSNNLAIVAYMMMLPVDLTNKDLAVKLTDSEGNEYVSPATIASANHNFTAASARWITADNFAVSNMTQNVSTAGTLSTLIPAEQAYKITSLKLTGKLNGDDIAWLRTMAGGQMVEGESHQTGVLQNLDLSQVTIVSGGCYYNYWDNEYIASNDEIGQSMFLFCSKLENIILPNNITDIGGSAFGYCSSLLNITIPNTVKSIGDMAFAYNPKLKEVTIPSGVNAIGLQTFRHCTSLTTVNVPASVTSIGQGTFEGCTNLVNITLPENLNTMGTQAFYNCSSLESVVIPAGIGTVPEDGFNGCSSLRNVTLKEGVKGTGQYAFASCDIANLVLPESFLGTQIGSFAGNKNLKEVYISDAVTILRSSTFAGCTKLAKVTIGTGCNTIQGGVFDKCTSLLEICCKATTPPTLVNKAFPVGTEATLYVPSGAVSAYNVNSDNTKWGYYFTKIEAMSE